MAFNRDKAIAAAERYVGRGQYDRAAKEYAAVVEADPRDMRAWLLLCDALVRSGQTAEGVERYLQVAHHYEQQGDVQKALAVYRQVLTVDPGRADVQVRCAELLDELGMHADADALYERAGVTYARAGLAAPALSIFQRLAENQPHDIARRLRLAELYSREGQVTDAVEHFKIACDILWNAGAYNDFVRVAERLLYHDASLRDVHRSLARAYVLIGQARKAVAKLSSLLQAQPDDLASTEIFAEAMAALGKPDKAASIALEIARRAAPGSADASVATRLLERVAEWDPAQTTEARRLLGDLRGGGRPPSGPSAQADAQSDGEVDLELDDELIEEVDEDLLDEPGASSDGASLAAAVVSEGRRSDTHGGAIEDVDKMLHEARVLVKYRLFEHASSHVEAAIAIQPSNVRALGLKAKIMGELSRSDEALALHLSIVGLVHASDPDLAAAHAEAALALAPTHGQARAWVDRLRGGGPPPGEASATAPTPAEDRRALTNADDAAFDDAFGLIEDEPAIEGIIPTGALSADVQVVSSPTSSIVDGSDVGLMLDDDEFDPVSASLSAPISIEEDAPSADETDFGGLLDLDESSLTHVGERTGAGAPVVAPAAVVAPPADPRSAGATVSDDDGDDAFAISVAESGVHELPAPPVEIEDRFGLDDDGEEVTGVIAIPDEAPASGPPVAEAREETDFGGLDEQAPVAAAPGTRTGAQDERADAVEAPIDDDVTGVYAVDDALAGAGAGASGHDDGDDGLDEPLDEAPTSTEITVDVRGDSGAQIEATGAAGEPAAALAADPPAITQAAQATDAVAPEPVWADLSGELGEIEFFVSQGLDEDARDGVIQLLADHPGHPKVLAVARQLGLVDEPAPGAAQVSAQASPEAAPHATDTDAAAQVEDADSAAAAPLLTFEDDDEDDFVAGIFGDSTAAAKKSAAPSQRARAEVSGADASTHFDLGTAYQGMGLLDDALGEFDRAAADEDWRARAMVMAAQVHVAKGDLAAAVRALETAEVAARNEDETRHAVYELAMVLLSSGDRARARTLLQGLPAKYRERDERLAELGDD